MLKITPIIALSFQKPLFEIYPVPEIIAAGPAEYEVVERKIDPQNANINAAITLGTPAPKAIERKPAYNAEIYVAILGKI